MKDFLPTFATNRPQLGDDVASEVSRLLRVLREAFKSPPEVAIATAYINPAGFNLLADELEQAPRIRLLLGAEPDPKLILAKTQEVRDVHDRIAAAAHSHEEWLRLERDFTGFTREALDQAERMVKWLKEIDPQGNSKVEVRRFTKGFLHGKAYISSTPGMDGVLAGSSNMTYAGLKLNAELNLGYPAGDQQNGKKVVEWFEEYWVQSEPYDLASVYESLWLPHTPWEIFLRMLYELYGSILDEEKAAASSFNLTSFQVDGVARMKRLLEQNGGVIVADEVGLGKTFLAGEVIMEATDIRRQRVLVICPASLKKSMWEPFLKKQGFRLTDVVSYDEVRSKMDPEHPEHHKFFAEAKDYAMVVVDEAHNLRNPSAERSRAIDRVILEGKHPKQVVLLTATPVNNSLMDLDSLIRYFIRDDARFAGMDIPSIREYIKRASDMDPENLTPDHLFQLMDQVAVRRTRKFIKENYPDDVILNPQGQLEKIKFPTPRVRRIDYELSVDGDTLVDAMLQALEVDENDDLYSAYTTAKADPNRLMMARYTPSRYLKRGGGVERIQIQNAGLLRSALLKRLESSSAALHSTIQTLINSHKSFLLGIEQGFVLEGEALRLFMSSESDDLDEVLEQLDDKALQRAKPVSDFFIDALVSDATSDLDLLFKLLDLAELAMGTEDTKFDALIEQLQLISASSKKPDPNGIDARDKRKVIIFSTYSDTVIDLHEKLSSRLSQSNLDGLEDYKDRIAEPQLGSYKSVHKSGQTGGVNQSTRVNAIEGFAPKSAGYLNDDGEPVSEDLYDILITTDVLAEGVNLQQASHIINYDLPWNPMKIVQRHGRIDRLFNQHPEVFLGLFFPAEHLDEMLGLQSTLERKLAQAEAAVGAANVLPGRDPVADIIYHDKSSIESEFEKLLDRRGSEAALSGEEFRRRLFKELDGFKDIEKQISQLPYGSGSGFVSDRAKTNGYVFCIKIANHTTPWFRYIQVDKDWKPVEVNGRPNIISESLFALSMADPQSKTTERKLSDHAYSGAFDAWQIIQESVHKDWQLLTDPINLQPKVPASFMDAADFVLKSGESLGTELQMVTLARLRTVAPNRVTREMRRVLNLELETADRLKEIINLLDSAGIQPASDPIVLPAVNRSEVRLVSWMAIEAK